MCFFVSPLCQLVGLVILQLITFHLKLSKFSDQLIDLVFVGTVLLTIRTGIDLNMATSPVPEIWYGLEIDLVNSEA